MLDNVIDRLTKHKRGPADILRPGPLMLPATDAALLLRECRFWGQTRDNNEGGMRHVAVLSEIMRRGGWRGLDPIAFAHLPDNSYVILDGHHRLRAQEVTGFSIVWIIVIHECRDRGEVERLFYSFNTNTRMRTTDNVLASVGFADSAGLSKTDAKALYAAAPLLASKFNFARDTFDYIGHRLIDDRLATAQLYFEPARKWAAAIAKAPDAVKKALRTQGACAVALACFEKQPDMAAEFWSGVAVNDGLRAGDPRHTYLKALQSRTSGGTAYVVAKQASVAWNAWFRSRDLTFIRVREGETINILGTDFAA